MTIEADRPAPAPPAAPAGAGTGAGAKLALHLPGVALTILSAVMLGFVVHLTLISQLRYERDQQTRYADFRAELAQGTAPVGQVRVDYTEDPGGKESVVAAGSPVALLRVPAIDLETVVVSGTSSQALTAGPGLRRDTVLPGQSGTSVVMGRKAAYGGPFASLDLLVPGDPLTVVTGQGESTYRVIGLRRAGDPVPPPPAAGSGRLVLITADGDPFLPEDILRVDADLTSAAQPTPARRISAAQLPPADAAMAGEPGAWTPLMLWAQALVLATLGITALRIRWGRWQTWIAGAPLIAALGLAAADQAARLLPNLL